MEIQSYYRVFLILLYLPDDRSLCGDRDSELAIRIQDTAEVIFIACICIDELFDVLCVLRWIH